MAAIFQGAQSNTYSTFKRSSRVSLPVGEMSDKALIDAVAGRDMSAMRALYVRHNLKIFRFLLRLTNDRALAEDLVTDVFLGAWRSAGSFRADSQVSTWLFAIARNEAWAALRRRRECQLDENVAATVEDTADNPETAVDKLDRAETLQVCLKMLSAMHREVIDLIYYHQKSIDEVAAILGVPPATVKTRAFYARSQMAEMLRERGIEHAVS